MRTSTSPNRLRGLLTAGGFALVAAAAPAVLGHAAVTAPTSEPAAMCPPGEHPDVFSALCVPHVAPSTSSGATAIPGNLNVPVVNGVPCTPENIGQCIGLRESQQGSGPHPAPRSSVAGSP